MTVRLRPHHLLCLLTYVGKGYSPAFVANYDRIAARIAGGETVQVVDGPDDVCAPLLAEPDAHCRDAEIVERDRLAAEDVGRLLGRPVEAGAELLLDPATLARLRGAFATGATRSACFDCSWSDLCSAVAGSGYADTRIPHAACGGRG